MKHGNAGADADGKPVAPKRLILNRETLRVQTGVRAGDWGDLSTWRNVEPQEKP